jgi:hypothetical protein
MPRGWRRTLVAPTILIIVGLMLMGVASSAWAHNRPAPLAEGPGPSLDAPEPAAPPTPLPSVAPEPPAAATGWLALVLTLALSVGVVAPRRALALALVLVLGVLAVETGVHSVHHLADRQAASECAVASVSAHVHGAAQASAPDVTWVPTPIGTAPPLAVDRPGSRSIRPDEGRAPPAA